MSDDNGGIGTWSENMTPSLDVGEDVWASLENMRDTLGFEDVSGVLAEVAAAWASQAAPIPSGPEAVRAVLEDLRGDVGAALAEGEAAPQDAVPAWVRAIWVP